MKKMMWTALVVLGLSTSLLFGCGTKTEDTVVETEMVETTDEAALPDGTYTAEFVTDSSMFHANEACEGKGRLTIENGEMTFHVSLPSKNILNLYLGLAEDAQKEGAELLQPTMDTVTYSDGISEEVHGFDIPVKALDEEFHLALIGTKGKWYDHVVSVCHAVPEQKLGMAETLDLADGMYEIELDFEGGSGKAFIASPAKLTVKDGIATATVEWSSENYDYMIVAGEKFLPINTEGNSVFEIPVLTFDAPVQVIGDTVAMSTPHEIEYTLTFHTATIQPVE